MAKFSTNGAEKIYAKDGSLAGYIKQHTPELWLPLDADGENISGPTYKADAETIVFTTAGSKK